MVFLDQLCANRIDDIATAFVANGTTFASGHPGLAKHDESAFIFGNTAPAAGQPVGGMGTGQPAGEVVCSVPLRHHQVQGVV